MLFLASLYDYFIASLLISYTMSAMNKFIALVIDRLSAAGARHFFTHAFIMFLIVLPMIFVSTANIYMTYQNLSLQVLEKRQDMTYLASVTVKEKLDHLTDIGISFATRVQFRRLVEEGKWSEAQAILKDAPKDFPAIETVSLVDPKGVVKETSSLDKTVIGKDLSFRDWYIGVSREWKPYISNTIKAVIAPYYNSTVVTIPIKSDSGKVIGILTLLVRTDTLLGWVHDIKPGEGGFTYIVDTKGFIVAHPTFSLHSELVDFSEVPAVQKTKNKESGVLIGYNPIEKEDRVAAYASVPGYGWGVVIQEPAKSAFAVRNNELKNLAIFYGFIILFGLVISYLLAKIFETILEYRRKEKIYLESIGDGVIAIDRDWNIIIWNKAAGDISGFSKEEAIGKPFKSVIKFIREHDRTENLDFINETMLSGTVHYMENHTLLVKKSGEEIPVGDSSAPLVDSAGKVVGAIIIFRDVSKEYESAKLHSDFAYASHQLATPVNKAMWSLESALAEKGVVKKVKEKMRIAYGSIESTLKLVGQLRLISEIDQKIIIPQMESVRLADVVAETMKKFEKIAKEKKIKLDIEPISPVLGLKTDAHMLGRILFEIIENALIYGKAGSAVHIATRMQDADAYFEISGEGIGITEEQQPLIFTKFFRGGNFDTTDIVGAGIGLFIAREYVKLLKGKIWFKSESGKGTVFFVSLPVA